MSVTTRRVVDKRIEPQPAPVYATTIGPAQNQFYKIPASGLSNSYLTFNNLTTLGTDRAYLDTFELEITAKIHFEYTDTTQSTTMASVMKNGYNNFCFAPPNKIWWTFESFPFNKVCEEARVNINGGAFFSSPLSYLRAKERYWDQKKINDAYTGICPCQRAMQQNELGLRYDDSVVLCNPTQTSITAPFEGAVALARTAESGITNSRLISANGIAPTASGTESCPNNYLVKIKDFDPATNTTSYECTVTWREPIFATPFSSRIDANYGRPLYNITSIDIAFNLQDLRNMLIVTCPDIQSYQVSFESVNLCYQVETIPQSISPPPATVVPYRRFVPYITDYKGPSVTTTNRILNIKSGVYTLNEVPTAIWIFAGPTKKCYQTYMKDTYTFPVNGNDPTSVIIPNSYNKTFGFIRNLSISMANTTQMLSTATPQDLFRICKANGLQDCYQSWGFPQYTRNQSMPALYADTKDPDTIVNTEVKVLSPLQIHRLEQDYFCPGVGSVIRLIPGTDLVIPDQDLIPGANANNLVFTVEASFEMPTLPYEYEDQFALWLLFEYVGVATITPGQCDITMNPLGDGSIMKTAPVESASATEEPSTTESGAGWLDTVKDILGHVKQSGMVGNVLGMINPVAGTVAKALGFGERGAKRPREGSGTVVGRGPISGGATMGLGDFC